MSERTAEAEGATGEYRWDVLLERDDATVRGTLTVELVGVDPAREAIVWGAAVTEAVAAAARLRRALLATDPPPTGPASYRRGINDAEAS